MRQTRLYTLALLAFSLVACQQQTSSSHSPQRAAQIPAQTVRTSSPQTQSAKPVLQGDITIMYVGLGALHSYNAVKSELKLPVDSAPGARQPHIFRFAVPTQIGVPGKNPLNVSKTNFDMGTFRSGIANESGYDKIPLPSAEDLAWYDQAVKAGIRPDVFVISGHQVAGMGWHTDTFVKGEEFYERSIYLPTLLKILEVSESARILFSSVKFVFIGGCNGLVNFEPHGPNGEYLTPEQIRSLYDSGEGGKARVIGQAKIKNTLEFYRARLAKTYGGDFTRGPKDEICADKVAKNKCELYDLDRVLPDEGLFDGSHSYNYPYWMKRIFSNAVLVMGYHSTSPLGPLGGRILAESFSGAKSELNRGLSSSDPRYVSNVLYPLIDGSSTDEQKRTIIESIRRHWTLKTVQLNHGNASGSITPAYPDLDRNGVFNISPNDTAPRVAPYEPRE